MLGMIIGAAAIGIVLGLLGSGGSILTVPILVYVLGHGDKVAIAESLAIVGSIALVGALSYARAHQVDWWSVVYFGLPGMLGTYAGAWLARFIAGPIQLVIFAIVMLLAAAMIFRRSSADLSVDSPEGQFVGIRHPMWQIVIEGFFVGTLTGLVGVGGGFLIVPALVLLGGLPMRLAVGTSLIVIGMTSLSGFLKYLHVLQEFHVAVDWTTISVFVGVGIVGVLAGKEMSQRVNQQVLRRGFAIFLIVMGVFVLGREIPHLLKQADEPTVSATPESSLLPSVPQARLQVVEAKQTQVSNVLKESSQHVT